MLKEMIRKYSETVEIKTYETDFKGQVTPTALLSYMQEVATNHAATLGLGRQASLDHGFFWVLGRLKYTMSRIPLTGETLEIRTWPAGVDGICALRRFEFVMSDVVVGEGFNYWLMIDTETFKMVKPDYFFEKTKDLGIAPEDGFKLKKQGVPKTLNLIYERTLRQSDMDWNNHMNNTKYATLIYDALPAEVLEQGDISNLQINYLKEMKIGDHVEVHCSELEGIWHVIGKIKGQMMFTATVEMQYQ